MPNIAPRWANIASRCVNIGPRRHQPGEREQGPENYALYGVFGVAKRNVWSRCPRTMCFTEFSGLQTEVSRLNLCENHVFYSACGAATGLSVCENHVFYGFFGVAARSVRARHVGETTSTGQSASFSRRILPGSPTVSSLSLPSLPSLPRPAPGCQA